MGLWGMDKSVLRKELFNFLYSFGKNFKSKFNNICGKTGQYNVPLELYQKRTSRKNRVLMSWQSIKKNNLSFEQLDSFEGGLVVDFKNYDFFDEKNNSDGLFLKLKNRLGSNENVSSVITIRSEEGSSSSAIPREVYDKLISNTHLYYQGKEIVINEKNVYEFAISQDIRGRGQGNDTWSGCLYISIKGGQQDTIETHKDQELTLFNPACEYASQDVCCDIDLVMGYYALSCIKPANLNSDLRKLEQYNTLLKKLEIALAQIEYDNDGYSGNLLDFVKKQYSISLIPGQLTDPIQISPITIDKFDITKRVEDSLDITHEEPVVREKYYWDKKKQCVLSPARPTNIFWSYHLSNMMQQNFTLKEFFKFEEDRFNKRKELIAKGDCRS